MPRSPQSPRLTNAYRQRIITITDRVERAAVTSWPSIDTLDGTRWPERMAAVVGGAQTEAARAASGYLTAFLSLELGRRVPTVNVDSRRYTGLSRDGRPLVEALHSPVIGVLAALKDRKTPQEALAFGRQRATRMVEVEVMNAARSALTDAIDADDRLEGWERVTRGTCGACLALSGDHGPHFHVHPGCKCVPQPRVKGVADKHPVPSGDALFAAMSKAEQDEQFGQVKAAALRAGVITLADLVDRSELDTDQPDYITETPLHAA
jgi:hypothetical protein